MPFGLLVWGGFTGGLGANPLSEITNETGVWTLRLLVITLAITPIRRLTSINWIKYRRMVGLYAFFYGSMHFLTYIVLDRFAGLEFRNGIVAWSTVQELATAVAKDIYKRPFITIGFVAFVSTVPLAATSTAGMIRRLGGRNWARLHRLVYVSGTAGVVHYWWLVKADVQRPLIYGSIVAALLGVRAYRAVTSRMARRAAPRAGGRRTPDPAK